MRWLVESASEFMAARHRNTNKPGNAKVDDDKMVRTIILSNDLRSESSYRTYNADFELAHNTVSKDDDWGHILALQGVDRPAAEFLPFIAKAAGVSEKQVSETISARCFREWARKLYYKITYPETFNARYLNENFMHTLNHATRALQHVNDMTPGEPFENLLQLFLECGRAPQCQHANHLVRKTQQKDLRA